MATTAAVKLWGRRIGAVSVEGVGVATRFEYDREFLTSGIEVAPLRMPLGRGIFEFPGLNRVAAFDGLPGLLADSLPDRWGRTLVDGWLQAQGRSLADFDVVERLCYVGARGMGALEFEPARSPVDPPEDDLRIDLLVALASDALAQKERFVSELLDDRRATEVAALLSLGTSAGGARPKALVAYNEETGQVRSGQLDLGPHFKQLIIKFDGVARSGDHGIEDPQGWGAIEYAYSLMARAAGVEIADCSLLEESGRRHFMTERFDRVDGSKLHMQTIAALEHADYNEPGTYSYEQAFRLLRRLGLGATVAEELYRRMAFNVVARNQDDHVKNFAFLMDRAGMWNLAPAFDLTWACQPGNRWLEAHQMSIAGKRDNFIGADLEAVAEFAGLKRGRGRAVLAEVDAAVARWSEFASLAGVSDAQQAAIGRSHRLGLLG
jgi:serine/threonine-protein kinase HipA